MKEELLGYIRNIINYYLGLLAFLVPIFFGPWSTDQFDFNKSVIIIGSAGILLILWLTRMTLEGKITIRRTALDIPLFFFALTLVTSSLLSANKIQSLVRLELWTWLSCIVMYFVYTNNRIEEGLLSRNLVLKALKFSGFLIACVGIVKALNLNLPYTFDDSANFTPVGSIISLDVFMLILIITELGNLKSFFANYEEPKEQRTKENPAVNTVRFAFLTVVILALISINPLTRKTNVQGLATSWQIASDIVKDKPLFGFGPGLYHEAFAIYKPFSFNSSESWSTIYENSQATAIHILSITGIVGLIVFAVILGISLVKLYLKFKKEGDFLATATAVLALTSIFIFYNTSLLFLFFILLAVNNETNSEIDFAVLRKEKVYKLIPYGLTLPLSIFILIGLAGLWRVFAAEVTYKKANTMLETNTPLIPVYNAFSSTTALNPYNPQYRMSFSVVSLSSAETIISVANGKKEKLTTSDQELIKNLITQSRKEADAAVELDQESYLTWENRAIFYRKISIIAPDALDFAVSDYKNAIQRNPNSPILRARLGMIYRDIKKDLELAKATLLDAVSLKPNYPEARLELARTYALLDAKDSAISEYNEAVNNFPNRSEGKTNAEIERDAYKTRGVIAVKEKILTPEQLESEQANDIISSVQETKPNNEEQQNTILEEPEITPTVSPTIIPSTSPTAIPTATPTATPTFTPTPTPTLTPTPTVTETPTPTTTPTPSITPAS